MPFVDREPELAKIAAFLASPRSELIIVYGPRGVGTSALLAEALGERPHVYYQATTGTLPQQLADLTAALRAFAPHAGLPGVLPSLEAALEALAHIARTRPREAVTVVIDELPSLAQADPAAPTVLQRWWDDLRRRGVTNLKVFLLGSLVNWMEEQTLSERGPLHNGRTGQMRLAPLGYRDAALFYPRYRAQDRIAAYAVWGGMPSYLAKVDQDRDLWDNVRDGIPRPGARLAEGLPWLRFSELPADAPYSSMLRALALGEREGEGPVVTTPPGDHLVDRLRHLLGMRRYDEAMNRIQEDLDRYVSERAFADVCRQFLWQARAADRLPALLQFDAVGAWWVANKEMQDEIAVVAMEGDRAVLIGECKWSQQAAGSREMEGLGAALRKAAGDVRPTDRPWRAFFSRSGFTDELHALAHNPEERVLLFAPDDLYW